MHLLIRQSNVSLINASKVAKGVIMLTPDPPTETRYKTVLEVENDLQFELDMESVKKDFKNPL